VINTQIVDYVQKSLQAGTTVEQISSALSSQGWSPTDINEALLLAQEVIRQKSVIPSVPRAPTKTSQLSSNLSIDVKNMSASQILLYLGGLIVVLAGVTYLIISWSQWGSTLRIISILLPTLACYVTGAVLYFSEKHKEQGIFSLLVGAILFPIFLYIMFKELSFFEKTLNDAFNFTLYLLSFVLYLVSSYIFRFPVWSFMYHGTGLLVCYFALKLLGIGSIFSEPTMAWIFLVLGAVYILLSQYYSQIGMKDEGEHALIIGAGVTILSLVRLFAETMFFRNEILVYYLFGLGLVYFSFGVFCEKKGKIRYSQVLYLIGLSVIFVSLLRLGFDGLFFKDLFGSANFSTKDLVGWSNLTVGIVYLLLAWGISKSEAFGLKHIETYKDFFNIVGPLWTLGAIFYLGLGGEKFLYESLLLLASLGFIFGSVVEQSRQFLYIGTLFLVIYIFSIGGEYFQNEAGWPVTLFVAGLASMGIGIGIERVRRKYFIS